MKTALTIAGSDSSGGAGIQADIKTMTANKVFATSAITALTAQNTTGVTDIMNVTPEFLREEIDAVFTDIRPDAVKIGMVSESGLIEVIAEKLKGYQAENIVVDPVMVATSGAKLISDDAISTLKEKLLPLATVITPNIPEGEVLSGMEIRSEADMVTAARKIQETYGTAVLLKGGHTLNDANDLLVEPGKETWFRGNRVSNPNTHGTGCTLSSAIAANLAKGSSLQEAVKRAKNYISGALNAFLDLGKGAGPMDHTWLWNEDTLESLDRGTEVRCSVEGDPDLDAIRRKLQTRTYPRGNKKVSDSVTELIQCVRNEDINGSGRLFGGRLMEWIDETAGVAATRHCGGEITTAAVDNLQFKHGAKLNDIVVVRAKVTYVGHTSMEVRTDTYIEDKETGIRRVINRAYFTEVYVDHQGHPLPLRYGLDLENASEVAEWEGALKRIEIRKKRRHEGF